MFWHVAKEELFEDISILVEHEEMSFKDIFYLELWRLFLFGTAKPFFAIGLLPVVENYSSIRLPLSSTRYILMLADSISLCICIGNYT